MDFFFFFYPASTTQAKHTVSFSERQCRTITLFICFQLLAATLDKVSQMSKMDMR